MQTVIDPKVDRYAVFGFPIKHSKSPLIHQSFAQQTGQKLIYYAQEVPKENFGTAVEDFISQGGKGLNCTVPLKELAWELANSLTSRALLSKAVNTLSVNNDGSLSGDNTDGVGLVTDLRVNHGITLAEIDILILGAGGASRGIISPLMEQCPGSMLIANRTVEKAQHLAEEFSGPQKIEGCGFSDLAGQQFDLILNATSASLSDQLPPLPDTLLKNEGICYDLAYANQATPFVRWGLENNAAQSLDGLGMLIEQAAEAFHIWRGVRPETQSVIALLNSQRTTSSSR